MKNIVLFICINLVFVANAQVIKSGIYEINSPNDTLIFKTKNIENTKTKIYDCIKKQITNTYIPLIDKKFNAKYAVLAQTKDENGKVNNKMIILNDKILPSNVTYSDSIVRKYYEMSFSLDPNYKESWYFTDTNDFFSLNYQINNYASDYDLQEEWKNKKNVEKEYSFETFSQVKDTFYLKLSTIKVYKDSLHMKQISYDFYKYTDCYFTTEQPANSFKLKKANNYTDILSIQKELFFYSKKGNLNLQPGDFLAVTNQDDEWYFGDYIQNNGTTTNGKIFKTDLILNVLTKTVTINKLKLKLYYTLHDENYGSEKGQIYFIKIYNNQKQLLQVIENAGLINDPADLVSFQDVNFDGFQDLVIYAHDGGAGPNSGNNYYIFNPETKQFIFNQTMSDLTQTEIDSKNKIVTAAWRNGAANHGFEKYKWINGALVQIEYYETTYLNNFDVEETHLILKNGKMEKWKGKRKSLKKKI